MEAKIGAPLFLISSLDGFFLPFFHLDVYVHAYAYVMVELTGASSRIRHGFPVCKRGNVIAQRRYVWESSSVAVVEASICTERVVVGAVVVGVGWGVVLEEPIFNH